MKDDIKKIVMFDFDGVLVDTLIPCYEISQEFNEDLSLDFYKTCFDGNIFDSLSKNEGKFNKHPDFDFHYEIKTRGLKIPQELKDIIKELSFKFNICIISSTPTDLIKKIIDRENISEYFTEILGRDIHINKVYKIKMILNKYSLESDSAVFITDTLGDIREGTDCGVKSIAVTWGFHDRKNLEKGCPAYIIDNPNDLTQAVENILK
ncbi:MAG: HAD hydrolase-like protein [Candidatus Paceibacterota bacterium]